MIFYLTWSSHHATSTHVSVSRPLYTVLNEPLPSSTSNLRKRPLGEVLTAVIPASSSSSSSSSACPCSFLPAAGSCFCSVSLCFPGFSMQFSIRTGLPALELFRYRFLRAFPTGRLIPVLMTSPHSGVSSPWSSDSENHKLVRMNLRLAELRQSGGCCWRLALGSPAPPRAAEGSMSPRLSFRSVAFESGIITGGSVEKHAAAASIPVSRYKL